MRPQPTEYAPFYETNVSLVPEQDIMGVLQSQNDDLVRLAGTIPAEKELFRYAGGKWSVRQVFGHMIDAERVFGYRAYCIGRHDPTNLPSFDQNAYVARADFDHVPVLQLAAEFRTVRQSHLLFLQRFGEQTAAVSGSASGKTVTVRALQYIMAGHVRHHVGILREKYGIRG